jgi:hypothetical protein
LSKNNQHFRRKSTDYNEVVINNREGATIEDRELSQSTAAFITVFPTSNTINNKIQNHRLKQDNENSSFGAHGVVTEEVNSQQQTTLNPFS